ncbi:unnamed protein product [Oikopleura dioica]|uniref:DOCKER domain-containing protein n=1 Tax=Oikopleura dioica TaxID=34765 RepID=E4X5R5_OIKDI|nr:unnamed protein product [Oikopleura dioica]
MFPEASTESEVKELLIAETITMMEDAKEFSKAIQLCSILESYYSELDDSAQISDILRIRSGLIARAPQGETAYSFFYLGFWGSGYPKNFQNVQMIARGEELERLEDFQESVLEWFPNAKLILNSDAIPEDVKKGQEQNIQIFPVKPKPFHGDVHGLRQFEHRKKFSKSSGIENASVEEKTFITVDSLPGVSTHVKIGHVTTVTRQPIEVALESIKAKNEEIKKTVKTILTSNGDNGHLGMLLQGTIDARVNGGLKMYEDAFLGDQSKIPSELQKQLKKVIRDQIPILEKALVLHGKNISSSLLPLHKNLLEMFEKMKTEITTKYGQGEAWELPVRRRCLRKIRDPEELSIESSSSSELRKSEQGKSKTRPVSWMESTHNIALSAYGGSEQSLSERGRRRRSKTNRMVQPTSWLAKKSLRP